MGEHTAVNAAYSAAWPISQMLLQLLPDGFSDAEITLGDDGEVEFGWWLDTRWNLDVSISEKARISYSAMLGKLNEHGSVVFDGQAVPAVLLKLLAIYSEPGAYEIARRKGEAK